ncbi:MAG: hypothetical protein R3F19_05690 [Verrucomicrobiales bacterium]
MKLTLHQVRGRRPPLPPKRLSAFRSEFDPIVVKNCPAASNSLKNPLTFDSVEERDRATCWKFAPDAFDRDLQTGHALDEANSLPTGKSAIYGAIALCLIASSSVWYLSFAEGQGEVLHPIPSGETAMLPLTSEVENQEREAGNFERALKAVRAFSECETLRERAAFVVDPNRVSPLMAAFYERAPIAAINWSSLQVEGMIKHDGQVDYLVTGLRADGFSPEWITVSVKEGSTGNANSYQIDWEAFVGYCSSTWEEFKSNPPSEPEEFRVFAQLGNYYSEPISDPRSGYAWN